MLGRPPKLDSCSPNGGLALYFEKKRSSRSYADLPNMKLIEAYGIHRAYD